MSAMRDRHIPRLCRSCTAPMVRQQDACWRCGAEWATEPIATALLQAEADARISAERWINQGGTYAEPPARRVVSAVAH
jgi:predicted amidophosphoribosyltransferase